MKKLCENCQWWVRGSIHANLISPLKPNRTDDEECLVNSYGQCRRMPPTVTNRDIERKRGKPILVTVTEFPDTPLNCCCGEWTVRSDPQEGA